MGHAGQRLPSERSFGVVFTGVFAVVGLWPAVVHGASPRWWALIVALGFVVCTAFWPKGLRPLNFVWYKFGMALHRVVNPLLMALIYFGAVVPMGLIGQIRGRDPLRMKRNPKVDSHWIRRLPPLPSATLDKQF